MNEGAEVHGYDGVVTVAEAESLEGEGKKLVREEAAKRDVTWEDGEETLPCQLTEDELDKVKRRVVHMVGEIEAKKAQIKSATQTLNGELQALNTQLSSLAKKAREGVEYRQVPTRTFKDYPRTTVYTIRLDTKEELRTRAMMGDEFLMELSTTDGKTFKELTKRPLEDTTTVCE